jgi:DNA-binding NarL/FixJ family response regulator
MIRVLVVDDEELVRAGLAAIAGAHPDIEVAGVAADGAEALDRAAADRPDVVLMDLRMPGMDGLAATRELTRRHPDVKVLVLTTMESEEAVDGALLAGASGFLLKSSPREQLWDGIRAVAGGDPLLAPPVLRRLIQAHLAARSEGRPAATLDLTERQRDLVRLVARGMSNSEIGRELHLAETTVKGYVSDILAKHGLRDRTQLAVLAYESGLVRPGGG